MTRARLKNAQVRGLLGLGHQAAQVRLGAVAQIVLLDGAVAEIEEPQAQAELAARGALHHAVPLQNHQKAVRGALVQLQGRGNLRQSQRRIALPKQIQYGKSPVQGLNFVGALRGFHLALWSSISLCGLSIVCRKLGRDVKFWYAISPCERHPQRGEGWKGVLKMHSESKRRQELAHGL